MHGRRRRDGGSFHTANNADNSSVTHPKLNTAARLLRQPCGGKPDAIREYERSQYPNLGAYSRNALAAEARPRQRVQDGERHLRGTDSPQTRIKGMAGVE
jgi:hypothetical protein